MGHLLQSQSPLLWQPLPTIAAIPNGDSRRLSSPMFSPILISLQSLNLLPVPLPASTSSQKLQAISNLPQLLQALQRAAGNTTPLNSCDVAALLLPSAVTTQALLNLLNNQDQLDVVNQHRRSEKAQVDKVRSASSNELHAFLAAGGFSKKSFSNVPEHYALALKRKRAPDSSGKSAADSFLRLDRIQVNMQRLFMKVKDSFINIEDDDVYYIIRQVKIQRNGLKGITMKTILADAEQITKELNEQRSARTQPIIMKARGTHGEPCMDVNCTDFLQYCKYKTELCDQYYRTGRCKLGMKCAYAHGEEELRPIKKLRLCHGMERYGMCPYGKKCLWAHNLDELTRETPEERLRTLAALAVSEGGYLLPDGNRLVPNLVANVHDGLPTLCDSLVSLSVADKDVKSAWVVANEPLVCRTNPNLKVFPVQNCMRCTLLPTAGSKLKKLACSHVFHEDCLLRNTNAFEQCPVCGSEAKCESVLVKV